MTCAVDCTLDWFIIGTDDVALGVYHNLQDQGLIALHAFVIVAVDGLVWRSRLLFLKQSGIILQTSVSKAFAKGCARRISTQHTPRRAEPSQKRQEYEARCKE